MSRQKKKKTFITEFTTKIRNKAFRNGLQQRSLHALCTHDGGDIVKCNTIVFDCGSSSIAAIAATGKGPKS